MYRDTNSLNSVGFRHVLEDGLAVLQGDNLAQERRTFVLEDLAAVVTEAKRCSDLAGGQSWFLANANQEAFQLFSVLERSLEREGKPWRAWLEAAAAVFESLACGRAPISSEQRDDAAQFLKTILSCVSSLPKLDASNEYDLGARLRQARL